MIKWIPIEEKLPPIPKQAEFLSTTILVRCADNTYEEAYIDTREMQWWYWEDDNPEPQKLRKKVVAWAEYHKGGY